MHTLSALLYILQMYYFFIVSFFPLEDKLHESNDFVLFTVESQLVEEWLAQKKNVFFLNE